MLSLFSLVALAVTFEGVGSAVRRNVSGVIFETFSKLRVGTVQMPFVGWGIREKSFGLFSVNVYAAAYYAEASGYPRALQITLLRDVDKQKIANSYRESLQTNGVQIAGKRAEVLDRISQDGSKADSWIFFANSADYFIVIDKQGSSSFEEKGISDDIFKIWFGKPHDKGLEALKTKLLAQSSN